MRNYAVGTTEKIANSDMLTVTSRLSMLITPLLIAVLAFVIPRWMDNTYASAPATNAEIAILRTRLTVVEGQVAAQAAFQRDVLQKLDRMQDNLSTLSANTAELAAIIRTLRSNGVEALSEHNHQVASQATSPAS